MQALATGKERVINWLVLQALPATRRLSGSRVAVPEQIDAAMFINSHHEGTVSAAGASSKHWFTTPFLQPLPYFVSP